MKDGKRERMNPDASLWVLLGGIAIVGTSLGYGRRPRHGKVRGHVCHIRSLSVLSQRLDRVRRVRTSRSGPTGSLR